MYKTDRSFFKKQMRSFISKLQTKLDCNSTPRLLPSYQASYGFIDKMSRPVRCVSWSPLTAYVRIFLLLAYLGLIELGAYLIFQLPVRKFIPSLLSSTKYISYKRKKKKKTNIKALLLKQIQKLPNYIMSLDRVPMWSNRHVAFRECYHAPVQSILKRVGSALGKKVARFSS